MVQSFRDLLIDWNAKHDERTKMQHAYLAVSLAGILVAGLVGLLNADASSVLLRICFAGLGVFLVNAIVWALLYSLVITKLTAKRPTRK